MKTRNSVIAALILLFATHSAYALDPRQPMKNYIQTHFTFDDNGLPDDIVNNIVQSRDGFLWIIFGSDELARFDGRRFTTLPEYRSSALTLGPDGALWVGAQTSLLQIPIGTSSQIDSLQVIKHEMDPSLSPLVCMRFSRSGILWLGTTVGLYRFEQNGNFSLVIPNFNIRRIEESANGNLLLSTLTGFIEWDGSRVVPHPEIAAELGVKGDDIFHVMEDSRGVTWVCTNFGIARLVGKSIEKLQPWGPKTHAAYRVYEDPQGNVWVAGAEGLLRVTKAGLERAVPGMTVRYMYGDSDGNLWVATNGDGLYRFKDRAVRMFTTADGLPSNLPMTVLASHDGALWTGYNCGGLSRFDGHSFHVYDEKDGLLNSCVWTLAEDANHDLWVGTYGGGVFRFHNGSFTQYSKRQGLSHENVKAVVPARDGSVWLTTSRSVSRLRNGQVRNYTVADGLSCSRFTTIYEDRSGGIWVGTFCGLYYLEGDRFLKVSSVPDDVVAPVGEDHDGALYVDLGAGRRGLGRLDRGQFSEVVSSISSSSMIEIDQGDTWFNGSDMWRFPRDGLKKQRGHDEPPDVEKLGPDDGLLTTQGSVGFPSLALTRDGKLWMATIRGLAMLDLLHRPSVDRKPAIYVKQIRVGRNQQPPGQGLVLPAGTTHVELDFDAVDISSPEKIRLQYRLDGVDSEWLDVTPPGQAIYSNIPAGTHAFHIRACNHAGIWDRVGIVYFITQQPHFYATTWFRMVLVATALMLIVGLYRLRLRQTTARLKVRFDERLAERTRIARELHDTLLQTVQGSKLVADEALDKAHDSVHLQSAMKRLSGWLGQATREGRAALNSLRTSPLETNGLAAALRLATEECVIDRPLAVKFSRTGGRRDMHPSARDEIYRIGYEAIRNAYEHSSATELEVELDYAQDLTLHVKDNGAGIEPAVINQGKKGHFGIQGMRERAARIRSKLTIVSAPNSGTEMTLVVPGNIIFRKANRFERIRNLFRLGNTVSDAD